MFVYNINMKAKKTNVYIFDFGSCIKIGQSGNVKRRLRDIETQSGREVIQHFSVETDPRYENLMHKILSEYRGIGEYFAAPFDFAASVLKSLVKFDFIREVKPESQLILPLSINRERMEELPMNDKMTGITISEMAKELGLQPRTVERRIQRAGIKPISREAIYSLETLETIRGRDKVGRPKKK
jgi:hypothetical protein